MLKTNELAILYAEVDCGPDMKNTLGEWMAAQRINQMISMMSESINKFGGIVSKTFDEGILGTFIKVDAAYQAADQILSNQVTLDYDETITTTIPLDVRIVLNYGKMLVVAGNISGDQLAESMQLASKTKAGTVLYTSNFAQKLKTKTKIKPKNLGKLKLEILENEVQAYQLDYGNESGKKSSHKSEVKEEISSSLATPLPVSPKNNESKPSETFKKADSKQENIKTVLSDTKKESLKPVLHIKINNKTFILDETSSEMTLGRAPDNTITVPLPYVSRKHLIIEYKDKEFVITNTGANRTYLKNSNNNKETICRDRESEILKQKGEISLGCPIKEQNEYLINFLIKME